MDRSDRGPMVAPVSWSGRHVISIDDFDRSDLLHVLATAGTIADREQASHALAGRIMSTLFFEPSTRTRLSFEAAVCKLGGKVIGFSDAGISSAKKGESLADTIHMVEQYSDVIVLRHPREGAARLAAEASSIPVINGGDGSNQHPTQTFLDLFTIARVFPGALEEGRRLTIAMAGDLRYGRTVHSLLAALTHFDVHILTVPVPGLELPDHHLRHARERGLTIETVADLGAAITQADVLYMTRLQQERFPDPLEFDHIKASYRVTADMLVDAKPELKILHPLPRVNEIAIDVDDTHHAHYFTQAGNGVPVRQALLALVLGVEL